MKLTIVEAARRAGVERNVLYRLIGKGRISKEIDDGKAVIDLSELTRIYPHAINENGQHHDARKRPNEHLANGGEQREIALLRERITALEADKSDLRSERDRLLAVVEGHSTAMCQLADQRVATAATAPPVVKRGLWARLRGPKDRTG
jgi:hypothetical protein